MESFDFTSLGVRIPVILISPWLSPGVDHTQYQNTSILRFVQDQLVALNNPQLAPLNLTQRDLTATSIANAFSQFGLANPRGLPGRAPTTPDLPAAVFYSGYQWNYQYNPSGQTYDGGYPELVMSLTADQNALAKQYLTFLPGHPDSGKPITREFHTFPELRDYREERRRAAQKAVQNREMAKGAGAS